MKTGKLESIIEKAYALREHLEQLSKNDQQLVQDLIEENHHSDGWFKHAIKRIKKLSVKFQFSEIVYS